MRFKQKSEIRTILMGSKCKSVYSISRWISCSGNHLCCLSTRSHISQALEYCKIVGSGFLKIADNQCLRVPPYIARWSSILLHDDGDDDGDFRGAALKTRHLFPMMLHSWLSDRLPR